jgi:hypothetical protein
LGRLSVVVCISARSMYSTVFHCIYLYSSAVFTIFACISCRPHICLWNASSIPKQTPKSTWHHRIWKLWYWSYYNRCSDYLTKQEADLKECAHPVWNHETSQVYAGHEAISLGTETKGITHTLDDYVKGASWPGTLRCSIFNPWRDPLSAGITSEHEGFGAQSVAGCRLQHAVQKCLHLVVLISIISWIKMWEYSWIVPSERKDTSATALGLPGNCQMGWS